MFGGRVVGFNWKLQKTTSGDSDYLGARRENAGQEKMAKRGEDAQKFRIPHPALRIRGGLLTSSSTIGGKRLRRPVRG